MFQRPTLKSNFTFSVLFSAQNVINCAQPALRTTISKLHFKFRILYRSFLSKKFWIISNGWLSEGPYYITCPLCNVDPRQLFYCLAFSNAIKRVAFLHTFVCKNLLVPNCRWENLICRTPTSKPPAVMHQQDDWFWWDPSSPCQF